MCPTLIYPTVLLKAAMQIIVPKELCYMTWEKRSALIVRPSGVGLSASQYKMFEIIAVQYTSDLGVAVCPKLPLRFRFPLPASIAFQFFVIFFSLSMTDFIAWSFYY